MPKRPTADTNDLSIFGGKKAKTLDDDLRELSGKIVKAAEEGKTELVAMLERREAELKQQQAEHKQQLAKAAYEKAKGAYEKIQKPGPKKEATKVIMDQAHAVYLALLGACFCLERINLFYSASRARRRRFAFHHPFVSDAAQSQRR